MTTRKKHSKRYTKRIGGTQSDKTTNRTAKGFRAMVSSFTNSTKSIPHSETSRPVPVTKQMTKGLYTMIDTLRKKGNTSISSPSIMNSLRRKPTNLKSIKSSMKMNTIEETPSTANNLSTANTNTMSSSNTNKANHVSSSNTNKANSLSSSNTTTSSNTKNSRIRERSNGPHNRRRMKSNRSNDPNEHRMLSVSKRWNSKVSN